MAKKDWSDMLIQHNADGDTRRVFERYLLPGKHTGYVVVCSNRRCFHQIRSIISPLGLLPTGMSPEDRKAVVAWATARMQKQTDDAFRHAANGTRMPDPFTEVDDG
jgi:hypothetical protein